MVLSLISRQPLGNILFDEFFEANAGLIVAELELEAVDTAYDKPHWIGEEVSHDERYYNVNLIKRPFPKW